MITSVEPELGGAMTLMLLSAFACVLLMALWAVSELRWRVARRITIGVVTILACTATGALGGNILGFVTTTNSFYYGAYAPLERLLGQSVAALHAGRHDVVLQELAAFHTKMRFNDIDDGDLSHLADSAANRLAQPAN